MASVDTGGGGKSANMELNIVPIIDLMSCLITFLLITAVWSQVTMIQIGSSIYGKQTADQKPQPPPPLADIPIRLDVKAAGFRLQVGKDSKFFGKSAEGNYEITALLKEIKKIKQDYPEKTDATLTVDDDIKYEYMIMGMDALLQGGLPSISVATGGTE